jgi:hypothetical protein
MVVRLTLGIRGIIHFFLCASAVKNGGAVDTWHSRDNSFFSLRLCGKKW